MTALLMLKLTLTPEDLAWINDRLEARYRQHVADRARYIRKDSSGVAEGCDVYQQGTGSPALENPAGGAPAESGAASSRVIRLRCPDCNGPMVEDSADAGLYCPDCWAYECRQRDL